MNNLSLLLVGVGGQGTILATKLLADVALNSGLDVKMSEIHGMAQRGGSVVTQIKIGEKIYSPLVEKGEADIVLAFEQLEALRWLEYIRTDGVLILNTQKIEPMPVILGQAEYPEHILREIEERVTKVTAVDALGIAKECGNPKVSNIVMMGVLARKLEYPKELWLEALTQRVAPKFLEINKFAFAKGFARG